MRKQKFSDEELIPLVEAGLTVTEIARRLNVSKGAVSQRLKRLKLAVAKDICLRSAGEIVRGEINALHQFQSMNEKANELLERALDSLGADDPSCAEGADSREIALKIMREIRGQLKLHTHMIESLNNMKMVADFQTEVLEAVGEASPDLRERIVKKLRERRAVRSGIEIPVFSRVGERK